MKLSKHPIIFIAIFSTILLSSCGVVVNNLPVFYTPPASSNHMSYLPKPMMEDSVKVKNYVSASFANNSLPYNVGDMAMGYINYNRSHVVKNFNFAYGGFGYFGGTSRGYENTQRKIIEAYHDQGFYGFGLRTSVGIAEKSGNTEFRILNWESAFVYEAGSYASFRKDVRSKNDPLSIASDKTALFTTGGSTEIIWSGRKNTDRQYGFRLFVGSTIDLRNNINYSEDKITGLATDLSFFIKIKNAYGILGSGTNLMNNSGKITLGYSF